MIKAKMSDKKWVTGMLASSFSDNPSVNYILSGDRRRPERILALMDYSFELCMRFGEVWLSDDRRGCALLLFPQHKRTTLSSIWLDLKLVLGAVGLGRIGKVLRRERLVSGKQPKAAMAYLWFIGVDPLYQHAGLGSVLLNELLKRADDLALPVYLETSVAANLPWYERFGFKVYDELDLGYRLSFLVKPLTAYA
ncbi:GNAT family N-acetyltransferase [Pedobacter panaciterrae]|uniref:GNAT family N-acetyltransferase n=1 Tax=Pedobacter panaciterrae TaxID=363849 RepID=A0ABU8NHG6_9SPHI